MPLAAVALPPLSSVIDPPVAFDDAPATIDTFPPPDAPVEEPD
jgi:hypothetical protein